MNVRHRSLNTWSTRESMRSPWLSATPDAEKLLVWVNWLVGVVFGSGQ